MAEKLRLDAAGISLSWGVGIQELPFLPLAQTVCLISWSLGILELLPLAPISNCMPNQFELGFEHTGINPLAQNSNCMLIWGVGIRELIPLARNSNCMLIQKPPPQGISDEGANPSMKRMS